MTFNHLTRITAAVALVLAVGLTAAGPVRSAADGIQWQNYRQAVANHDNDNRKLLLHFYADWCKFCQQMKKETFSNRQVIDYINTNFIPVRIDTDKDKQTAFQYRVGPIPDTLFVSEKGEMIGRRPGFVSASDLLALLRYIGSDSYLKMSYKAFRDRQ